MSDLGFARSSAQYAYLVADLRTGDVLDELPLHGVTFSTVLNDAGEFRGQLALGARKPRDLLEPGRTALYVVRDGVPVWGGVVWTTKYASADRSVEIGAAGFLSYFDRRRVLAASYVPGRDDVGTLQPTEYTDVDQADIARELIRTAQAHPDGDIGVRAEPPDDPNAPARPRTLIYQAYELKSVGEALRELAELDEGPDFLIDVAFSDDGTPVRRLRVGDPLLGQGGAPHVWDYGANLMSYTWPCDGASMAGRVFALGAGSESGQLIETAADPGLTAAGWPLTETEVSYAHLEDRQVLASIAAATLRTVNRPVILPELVVRADRDPVLGSYQVGDHAQVVIRDDFFPDGMDFRVRILAVEVTPDEETVSLTVSPVQEEQ
jgi:hypothetical protein